jgi:hypothetical protein
MGLVSDAKNIFTFVSIFANDNRMGFDNHEDIIVPFLENMQNEHD